MGEKRPLPFKTKLCALYQKGRCPRQTCTFAHGHAELQPHSPSSFPERRSDRDTDLRSKLDRKRSPQHRNSPGRDSHVFRRFATSPPVKRRKYRTYENMDGQSDFSGTLKSHNGTLDRRKGTNLLSLDSRNTPEDELKQVEHEVNLLLDERSQLEIQLSERDQELDSISSRIRDLEAHLSEEKEKFLRVTSKINKLIRVHVRHSQLKEEMKRSEVQLQQLVEEFCMNGISEDNLNVNIFSDKDLPEPKELASPGKRRLHGSTEVPQGSDSANTSREHGVQIDGSGRDSHLVSCRNRNGGGIKNRGDIARLSGENKFKHRKDVSKSFGATHKMKVLDSNLSAPPTSMAAQAIDEFVDLVEGDESTDAVENETAIQNGFPLPLPLPPLPLAAENNYSQYEDVEVKVDVDGFDDHEELDII